MLSFLAWIVHGVNHLLTLIHQRKLFTGINGKEKRIVNRLLFYWKRKVGNNVKIGAETFIINRNIPDNCTVAGVPSKIVKLNGKRVEIKLKKINLSENK